MDSGNSGSICSSGDEEYDSRSDAVPGFLNPPTHSHYSLVSHHQTHNPSLFHLSPTYLHALSQSQPTSNPNSMLNLDTHNPRSEPNATDLAHLPGVSSSSAPAPAPANQYLLSPHESLQSRSVHNDNARVSAPTNAVRNSKKRTRASRRPPTTVLTTDTSNFRAMVQEFTGVPAPPFSSPSYPRRLNLFTGSSSLETTDAFRPLRPSPQKLHPDPLLLSSSSPSTLLHNNMGDAIPSATNISPTTTNNSTAYHQLLPDLGLPYNQSQHMVSIHNHPILQFQPPLLHPSSVPLPGFSAKSQPSLEYQGMNQGQVTAHLMSGVQMPPSQGRHATSDGMPLRNEDGCRDGITVAGPSAGRRDQLRSFEGNYAKVATGSCKFNFSVSSSSCSFNQDKTLDNTPNRGEPTVDSWICSSD